MPPAEHNGLTPSQPTGREYPQAGQPQDTKEATREGPGQRAGAEETDNPKDQSSAQAKRQKMGTGEDTCYTGSLDPSIGGR